MAAADAAAGGGRRLVKANRSRRPAGTGAGGPKRRAGGLDLAHRVERLAGELPRSARALSRTEILPRIRPLLRVRPAGLPLRLASRPVGCGPEPAGRLAHRLRGGVAALERTQRPRPHPAPAAGPALR